MTMPAETTALPEHERSGLIVRAKRVGVGRVEGFVLDPKDLGRRLVVELWLDDLRVAVACADRFVAELARQSIGDGLYGYSFEIPPQTRHYDIVPTVSLRLANTADVLAVLDPAGAAEAKDILYRAGEVRWDGGLRLIGKLAARPPGDMVEPSLSAYINNHPQPLSIIRTFAVDEDYRWGAYRFDATLPASLADGTPYQVRIIDDLGQELEGSPQVVIAHHQGWRGIFERLRDPVEGPAYGDMYAKYLERMMPAFLPFREYADWRACLDRTVPKARESFVVIVAFGPMPGGKPVEIIAPMSDGVDAVVLTVAEAANGRVRDAGAMENLATRLAVLMPDLVIFVRAGTRLHAGWDAHLLDAADRHPAALAFYSDCEVAGGGQPPHPLFLPAFDRSRWQSQSYALNLLALRPDLALAALARKPHSLPGLHIAALEEFGSVPDEQVVVHLPRILATAQPTNLNAMSRQLGDAIRNLEDPHILSVTPAPTPETLPAVRITRAASTASVEIVIPTRDRLDLLEPCLTTLQKVTKAANWSVTIIDNGSVEDETLAYLAAFVEEGRGRVIRDDGPFNYARLNNTAVRASSADLICFMNNDIEIVAADWLEVMRAHFSDSGIAGVGARLVWPNGMVQHGGVVIGTGFAAAHAYDTLFAAEAGHSDGLLVERECSALTAACLMVRKRDFDAVGGFDEVAFPVAFNDVDLCLKLRAGGGRLVWTPHATLLHKESQSRGREDTPEKLRRAQRELNFLRARWGEALVEDPYYNPNLNLSTHPYSGLAMPPRQTTPRRNIRPVMARSPADHWPPVAAGEPAQDVTEQQEDR